MQPAFIRLIANLTKQLDQSIWRGTYEETPVWAETISQETQARVLLLRSELAKASPEAAPGIEEALSELPTPFPGYYLSLQNGDREIKVDLWDLCYQICFRDYDSATGVSTTAPDSEAVAIDPSLFEEDTGEVDWNRLDEKTQAIVQQIFANLPD